MLNKNSVKTPSFLLVAFTLGLAACGGSETTTDCDATTCTQPPAASCDGNTLITYAQAGTCDTSGACDYSRTETDCTEAGLVCLNATCTESSSSSDTDAGADPCDGVSCDAPPTATCDDNTAVSYADTGTCDETGTCTYAETRTDCGDAATCTEGACISDPAEPCDATSCDTPPADTCEGNSRVTYGDGTCDEAGECQYEATTTPCGETATCLDGVCIDNVDPCEDIICDAPPAMACDGNTVVEFALPGTCNEGTCEYVEIRTDCADGEACYAGSCSTVNIVINELHYNLGSAQGNDDTFEFLELYNAGDTLDLAGFSFSAGVTHTFESVEFPSDHYLVLTINAASYADVAATVIEWASGGLTNGGETVTLVDPWGNEVDTVTYDDGGAWPTTPDGDGASLELTDPNVDNSDGANWQGSWVANGTPGAANSVPPATTAYSIYTLKTEDYAGQGVSTGGIVTATYTDRYALQDGEGAYSGIWVMGSGVAVGDDVTVEGVLDNLSDLLAITQSAVTINSSENALPAAENLTTLELQDDSWEGVLVTTTAYCTLAANQYNEWTIDDESGPLLVDDLGYEFGQEEVGGLYTVTSPVYYSYGAFKLVPMSESDVMLADACSLISCLMSSRCEGNTAVYYVDGSGTCIDGVCEYEVMNTTDCGDGLCVDSLAGPECVDVDPNACVDVVCDAPPSNTCDGNTAVTYASEGTCGVTGACTYEESTEECASGCYEGACTSIEVIISELHYNPGSAQGSDSDYEFIELYNAGDTINLEGYRFTSGITHTFGSQVFESSTYLVVAINAASYANLSVPVVQWDSGGINNSGETVTLEDSAGNVVDTVTYDDGGDWPSDADGAGSSVELIDLTSDNSLAANWKASEEVGGSPGSAN